MTDLGPAFPHLHVRPDVGWVGSPCGPVRWNGRYHLFFQHRPDAPTDAATHAVSDAEQDGDSWGHAVSDDLCEWSYAPVAVHPTPGSPDAGGCWAGSVVDDGGVPTAVYTGVADDRTTATLCLATAHDDDLDTWDKQPTPVVTAQDHWVDLRDPFVFTHAGQRYALLGARHPTRSTPALLLYGCDDLRRWEYLGPLITADDPVAADVATAGGWEHPQLAQVDGRWVLVVSLSMDDDLTYVAYLVGDLVPDGDGLHFEAATGGRLDHGSAFYGPALLVEPDRVLLWGWAWEDRDEEQVAEAGWSGVLTWPRVLGLHPDGRLLMSPAPELVAMRATRTRFRLGAGETIPLPSGPVDVELMVRSVVGGPVRLSIGDVAGHLVMLVGTEPDGLLGIRVVVDGSLVEVHVGGGQSYTERRYPIGNGSWQLSVTGDDELTVDATVHRLVSTGA